MKYAFLIIILIACCVGSSSPNYYVNNQRAINLYDADVDCSLTINSGEEPTAYAVYESGCNQTLIDSCLPRNKSVIYLLLSNRTYIVIVYDMHSKPYSRHIINTIRENNYVVDIP